jgi:formylglycine-generating enzyme required for sulfatase activity
MHLHQHVGMKLNLIPAGTFLMGSTQLDRDRYFLDLGVEPLRKVTITKAFYIQTTEVTQGQWKAVMGTEPWKGKKYVKQYVKEGPNYPATYVSWNDTVAYCKKLSEKEGKTYRLPTEAEWEYACRAGAKTTWSFGDERRELGDYAWYEENAWDIDERYAHQVGLKKPNAFGLYDMHGNVYEWCHDYFSARVGPRVLRGGSWTKSQLLGGGSAKASRSAARHGLGELPTTGLFAATADQAAFHADGHITGFRVVRELD